MSMLEHSQMYTDYGIMRFNSLIVEFTHDSDQAVFTVRNEKEGYISLKKLFVDHTVSDPSEATFALVVFGDVGYWLKARDMNAIKEHLTSWREESEVIRKSKAFKALANEVENDGRNAFSAAKYLIEEPWKGRTKAAVKQKRATSEKAEKATITPEEKDFIKEYLQ